MKTINQVRLENTLALLKESGLKSNEFADQMEMSPSYFSRVKGGFRNIGPRLSREIEIAFHKPVGWIDQDPIAMKSSLVSHAYDNLTPEQKRAVDLVLLLDSANLRIVGKLALVLLDDEMG